MIALSKGWVIRGAAKYKEESRNTAIIVYRVWSGTSYFVMDIDLNGREEMQGHGWRITYFSDTSESRVFDYILVQNHWKIQAPIDQAYIQCDNGCTSYWETFTSWALTTKEKQGEWE